MTQHVVHRIDRALLWIGGAVDEPADPRQHHGTGAHRAGLQGDVERDAFQPPGLGQPGGLVEDQHLGMRRRVGRRLDQVVGFGEDGTVADQNGADRDFPDGGRVSGPRPAALEAVRAINTRHRTVRGPGYSATDPELLLWVHATLVYSAIRGYRALVGPLSDAEADQYYQDTKEIGVLLGIPREIYPERIDAFEAYLQGMIDSREVAVGAEARRMADLVLRPSFRGVPRLAFAPLSVITAGLLPPALREGYGLKWGRPHRAAFAACLAGLPRLVK